MFDFDPCFWEAKDLWNLHLLINVTFFSVQELMLAAVTSFLLKYATWSSTRLSNCNEDTTTQMWLCCFSIWSMTKSKLEISEIFLSQSVNYSYAPSRVNRIFENLNRVFKLTHRICNFFRDSEFGENFTTFTETKSYKISFHLKCYISV